MPPLDVSHDDDGGVAELTKKAAASCACDETARSSHSEHDPYAPAESLRLRIGEDIDWSDVVVGGAVGVAVLERDGSTKGAAANPKSCASRRSAAGTGTGRSSLSSAPAARRSAAVVVIGGLPAAKAARDHGRRRSPCHLQIGLGGRARVFASGEAAGAGRHQLGEPGSPKVSCLGGVRPQPRTAAEGIGTSGGRRWWAWLVADVMFGCCWNGRRRHRRSTASEAE